MSRLRIRGAMAPHRDKFTVFADIKEWFVVKRIKLTAYCRVLLEKLNVT
jgi:hypothetical protein